MGAVTGNRNTTALDLALFTTAEVADSGVEVRHSFTSVVFHIQAVHWASAETKLRTSRSRPNGKRPSCRCGQRRSLQLRNEEFVSDSRNRWGDRRMVPIVEAETVRV